MGEEDGVFGLWFGGGGEGGEEEEEREEEGLRGRLHFGVGGGLMMMISWELGARNRAVVVLLCWCSWVAMAVKVVCAVGRTG